MNCIQLDKNKHDRKSFDCGINALNHYLRVMANQQSNKENARTYILEDQSNPKQIIGFYTLTMQTLDLEKLPLHLQKKHKSASTCGLIARLAVDKKYAKKGFGEWLLIDALKKLLKASDLVGFPIITVDAKDGAAPFYEKFGFTPFLKHPDTLYMTITNIRHSLDIIPEQST